MANAMESRDTYLDRLAYVGIAIFVLSAAPVSLAAYFGQLTVYQAIVFSAVSAMGGWIISLHFSRRSSKKQHTLNVLTQARLSTEMNNRVRTFRETFGDRPIESGELEKDVNKDARAAAQYILNYYEFLAVALEHRDLDYDLLKDCLRGQLCVFYRQTQLFIEGVRKADLQQPSKRYSAIVELFKKWDKS